MVCCQSVLTFHLPLPHLTCYDWCVMKRWRKKIHQPWIIWCTWKKKIEYVYLLLIICLSSISIPKKNLNRGIFVFYSNLNTILLFSTPFTCDKYRLFCNCIKFVAQCQRAHFCFSFVSIKMEMTHKYIGFCVYFFSTLFRRRRYFRPKYAIRVGDVKHDGNYIS